MCAVLKEVSFLNLITCIPPAAEAERYEQKGIQLLLGKLINAYLDILFKFYAYVVGYLYLALPYSLSFIIPQLKRIINNFEENGSNLSILVISLISGSALFYLFIVVDVTDFSASKNSVLGLLGWYIGYFIWGYFALFLLTDYRLKAKQKEIS